MEPSPSPLPFGSAPAGVRRRQLIDCSTKKKIVLKDLNPLDKVKDI